MDGLLKNAEEERNQGKAWAPAPHVTEAPCDVVSTGGPCRQLGGSEAEELRRKLRAREQTLRIELQDVRRALNLLNNDESVQKVLEVISVANK